MKLFCIRLKKPFEHHTKIFP